MSGGVGVGMGVEVDGVATERRSVTAVLCN